MATFILGKLTALNSKRHYQNDSYILTNLDSQEDIDITAQSLEGLASKCNTKPVVFFISKNDEVQCYKGSARRVFPNDGAEYVLSSPSPEELAKFLEEYPKHNYVE